MSNLTNADNTFGCLSRIKLQEIARRVMKHTTIVSFKKSLSQVSNSDIPRSVVAHHVDCVITVKVAFAHTTTHMSSFGPHELTRKRTHHIRTIGAVV